MGAISDSRIIILEGTDGTGKTVLAQKLQSQGRLLLKADKPTHDNWFDEYIGRIPAYGQVVCDRWHLGEVIWPRLFGRESLFRSLLEFNTCHTTLWRDMDAFTIILVRDMASIGRTLVERGESPDNILDAVEGQFSYVTGFPSMNLRRVLMCTLPTAEEVLGLR